MPSQTRACFNCKRMHDGTESPRYAWHYCTPECWEHARVLKRESHDEKLKLREARRLGVERTCARPNCTVTFRSSNKLRKYCCPACGTKVMQPNVPNHLACQEKAINRPFYKDAEGVVRTHNAYPQTGDRDTRAAQKRNIERAKAEAARFLLEMSE